MAFSYAGATTIDENANGWGDSRYNYGGSAGGAGAAGALALGTWLVNTLAGAGNKTPNGSGAVKDTTNETATPGTTAGTSTTETAILDQAKNNILYKVDGGTGAATAGKEGLTNGTTKTPSEEVQTPELEDKTGENKEFTLNNFEGYFDILKQLRDEQWAREDAIREQTRYDQQHAYRYATEDMLSAGINPNLVGVTPAQSGGGITQATGMNTGLLEEALNAETQKFMKLLEQDWKGDENSKDRVMDIVTSIMQMAGQLGMGLIIGKTTGKTGKK